MGRSVIPEAIASRRDPVMLADGHGAKRMATILLVDDEKVARTVYGDYLTAAGHTVTCVGSVAEARAALALHPVDLVVTDLIPVSYTHLRAHETPEHLVCRL